MTEQTTVDTPVSYQVTREECQARISGFCPGCAGPVVPIETVDNARQPTHWPGCEHCGIFTDGCPPELQRLARMLVEEGTLVPYPRHREETLWLESNTREVARILWRIKKLQGDPALLSVVGTRRAQVQMVADIAAASPLSVDEVTRVVGLFDRIDQLVAERDDLRERANHYQAERDEARARCDDLAEALRLVERDRDQRVIERNEAYAERDRYANANTDLRAVLGTTGQNESR